jgi:hypothetical protein
LLCVYHVPGGVLLSVILGVLPSSLRKSDFGQEVILCHCIWRGQVAQGHRGEHGTTKAGDKGHQASESNPHSQISVSKLLIPLPPTQEGGQEPRGVPVFSPPPRLSWT